MVVVFEDSVSDSLWIDFARDTLLRHGPSMILFPATLLRSRTWVVEADLERVETLSRTLRALWLGQLTYVGPVVGRQQVGVELMKDRCWKCQIELRTITGLVVPDRKVATWSSTEWLYFNSLLRLSSFDSATIEALLNALPSWRAEDPRITLVGRRSTRMSGTTYWAAICPACEAVRGDFHVSDDRFALLHDRSSRGTGKLSYRALTLSLSLEAVNSLAAEVEASAYSCPSGWRFADDALTILDDDF